MHALPLLQDGICDLDRTGERIGAPVENVRKLTTIAGSGVTAEPLRSMAEIGSVPGMGPSSSDTNSPLT